MIYQGICHSEHTPRYLSKLWHQLICHATLGDSEPPADISTYSTRWFARIVMVEKSSGSLPIGYQLAFLVCMPQCQHMSERSEHLRRQEMRLQVFGSRVVSDTVS